MIKNKPRFSIITCTYNHYSFFDECLTSVFSQNYNNFEHIFIDSSDNEVVKKIVHKYSDERGIEINYKWVKPEGVYNAINQGIKSAKGDIIHILHQDDYYSTPDTLKYVDKSFTQNSEVGWIIGNANNNIFDKTFKFKYKNVKPKHLNYILKNISNFISHASTFVKRDVYRKHGLYSEKYILVSDYDLYLRLIEKEQYLILKEDLTTRRLHKDSLSGNPKSLPITLREMKEVRKINKKQLS